MDYVLKELKGKRQGKTIWYVAGSDSEALKKIEKRYTIGEKINYSDSLKHFYLNNVYSLSRKGKVACILHLTKKGGIQYDK